jgi:hypothetical protein
MDLRQAKIKWLIVSRNKVFNKELLCQLVLLAANSQTTTVKVELTETAGKYIGLMTRGRLTYFVRKLMMPSFIAIYPAIP